MNSFGNLYRFTTYGESHGSSIGGIIDGMPSGVAIDLERVQLELDRRRPGQSNLTTQRKEADSVEILSGMLDGITTGTPIGYMIANSDQHSSDYAELAKAYRPSHADYSYQAKYGIRDHRGGGRSSARETAARVVAGAFARQLLEHEGITVAAYTSSVGEIDCPLPYTELDLTRVYDEPTRCPDPATAKRMAELIEEVKTGGDTVGGVVTCVVKGAPAGLGEPLYDKLSAKLASAMMSIGAVKGFEYGMGFAGCRQRGSEMIDPFVPGPATSSNHSGGIQGGITNGCQDIYFRVGFKPVATLLREVSTINADGESTVLKMKGRHDPCVVPRAVPVVEAMACCVLLDAWLEHRARKL